MDVQRVTEGNDNLKTSGVQCKIMSTTHEKSEPLQTAPRLDKLKKPVDEDSDMAKKFRALKSFVRELSLFFVDNLNIKLYNHLLSKTKIEHTGPVSKHVKVFEHFVKTNREEILTTNTAFPMSKIEYTKRVNIDFSVLFNEIVKEDTAAETQIILFDHLLVLSMVMDPEGGAAAVLKDRKKNAEVEGLADLETLFKENDFLTDMMEKVEEHVKPGANPMEAMTSMMSSGLLQELVNGMQENIESGKLDMNQLMGSVQQMTASLPPEQLAALGPMVNVMNAQGVGTTRTPNNNLNVEIVPDSDKTAKPNNVTSGKVTSGGKKKRKKQKNKKKKKK